MKGVVKRMLAGFLIGIGCVLPGVSGGVMAVSFGLYRPMLDAVLSVFRTPRASLRFLWPLALGAGAGVVLCAWGLTTVMALYERQMLFLFVGLVVGGVPDLLREGDGADGFTPRKLAALAAGLAVGLPLLMAGGGDAPAQALTPFTALLTGVLEGVGTVVPGVSTSFLLIRLGWYQAYLQAVTAPQTLLLLCIGVGFAVAALGSMRAVQWAFARAQGYACYTVLGFLLVSVAAVLPPFAGVRMLCADAALVLIGAVIAVGIGRMGAAPDQRSNTR